MIGYSDWKGWRSEDFGAADPGAHAYFDAELRACGLDPARPRRVLEIGFGNGGFARFCRDAGWSYTGTELDPALVELGRQRGFDVYPATSRPTDLVGAGSLDLVAAFDVFEHVEAEALIALLGDLRAALASGGRILARFPNGDSPFSAPLYNGDMTHRTLLGIGKVKQVGQAAGLRVAACHGQTVVLGGGGARQYLRRSMALLVRRAVSFVLASAYFGRTSLVFDQNLVVVLEPTH